MELVLKIATRGTGGEGGVIDGSAAITKGAEVVLPP